MRRVLRGVLAASLVACHPGVPEPTGGANIINVAGRSIGQVTLRETDKGVRVKVDVRGLATGRHGIHIHAVGRCDPPDFRSAGPHWNPAGRQHGADNPEGKHAGDLPNLEVDGSGHADLDFLIEGATLGDGPLSLLLPEPHSIVIHADPDDERTDPAGRSGPRIACGILQR